MENNEPVRSEDKVETVSTGSQISPHGFIEDGSADGYPIDYSFMAKDLAEAAAKKESTPTISQENADHLAELRNFRDQTNIKVGENLPTTEPDRKDGMAEEAAKKKEGKVEPKELDEATYNEALRKNIALKEQNKILIEQNNQLKNRIDVLENRLDQLVVILIQTGRIPASMVSILNNPQNVVVEKQPTIINKGTINNETTPLKPEQGSSAQQLDIYIQSLINQRSSTTQGTTPPPITQQVIDQSNEINERIKANTPPALPTTPPELTPENIAQSNAISEWLKNQPPVLTPEIIAQGQKAEEEWKRKNTPPELPTTPPTLTQENLDWIKANTPPPVPGTVPPAITQSVIDQSNDISEWLKANTPPPVTRSVIRQGKRAGEQWEKANTPPPLPTTPPELTPDNIAWMNANTPPPIPGTPPALPTTPPELTPDNIAWMNANTPPPIPVTPPALPTTPPELTSENLEWIKANTPPPVPGTVPPAITQSVIDQSNAIRSAMVTPPPLPTTPPELTPDNIAWMNANRQQATVTPPPLPSTPPTIPGTTPPELPTTPPELTPDNIAWMENNKPQNPTEVIPNDSGFAGWTSNVQGGMEKTPQIVNEEIPARTTPPELPDWLLNTTNQAQQNTDSDVLTPNTGFSNWLSNPNALEENTPRPSMTSQLDSAINNLIQSSPQIEVQPTVTTNNRREKYVGPAKQMMRTLGK